VGKEQAKVGGKRTYGGSGKLHYELLRTYMPDGLEAFAITIYTNNYNKFMRTHWRAKHCIGCELSSVSHTTDTAVVSDSQSLFTSDSKGGGKYGGWSDEGKTFYNRVFDVIERQRAEPVARKAFEEKV
jgi:hypothetical protein